MIGEVGGPTKSKLGHIWKEQWILNGSLFVGAPLEVDFRYISLHNRGKGKARKEWT